MLPDDTRLIYKVCAAAEWRDADSAGAYRGSAVDLRDGFIHFSTAAQLAETLRRHFAGQRDLLVLAVDPDALGDRLRWEPSRGGDLFPHLYGELPVTLARRVSALDIDPEGRPRHPTAVTWQLPPRDRPALAGGLRRTNLRELLARPGRFEHHLMVVAQVGVARLEAVTASEPVYFEHGNVSDEIAIALPCGDPNVDALPLRTFFADPATNDDAGRVNHRVHDAVLNPYGLLHWPGRLRPPYEPPRFTPGGRRTLTTLVCCASRLTPPGDRVARTSPGRQADVKAYGGREPPFGLCDTSRDPAGTIVAIGEATLDLLVSPGEVAPPRGGYVVVLEAAPESDCFPGDLVYVPPGERLAGGGIARALLLSSQTAAPEPPPPSWDHVPAAPFATLEEAPRGSLPVALEGLAVREGSPATVVVSVAGHAEAEVPRYWLARMLFCLALHGYQMGYAETYGGFFYDDEGGGGPYRLGLRGGGEVVLDRRGIAEAVERLYRAVAPEGYVQRLA